MTDAITLPQCSVRDRVPIATALHYEPAIIANDAAFAPYGIPTTG